MHHVVFWPQLYSNSCAYPHVYFAPSHLHYPWLIAMFPQYISHLVHVCFLHLKYWIRLLVIVHAMPLHNLKHPIKLQNSEPTLEPQLWLLTYTHLWSGYAPLWTLNSVATLLNLSHPQQGSPPDVLCTLSSGLQMEYLDKFSSRLAQCMSWSQHLNPS